ncbi:MAG: 2-C-methyl-D-erythritol 4-phosphate cytidylyltransferase, partial [Actinomycetota bacterium]|nr:2-C-methyl-D-erythritol 4-phosphate cytidylyltransferase [Actinomycetota bacterium]
MSATAIVPAAGRGERLGGGPKAMRDLAGEPLLVHAVRSLWSAGVLEEVVVAAPAGTSGPVARRLRSAVPGVVVTVVDGAGSRRASVAAGLAAVRADADVV